MGLSQVWQYQLSQILALISGLALNTYASHQACCKMSCLIACSNNVSWMWPKNGNTLPGTSIKEKVDSSGSLVGRAEMYMLSEDWSSYIFQKTFSAKLFAAIPECGHQHLTTKIFEAEHWHQPRLHSPPAPSLAKQVKLCAWLEWRSWVESWVCSLGWELAKYFTSYTCKGKQRCSKYGENETLWCG